MNPLEERLAFGASAVPWADELLRRHSSSVSDRFNFVTVKTYDASAEDDWNRATDMHADVTVSGHLDVQVRHRRVNGYRTRDLTIRRPHEWRLVKSGIPDVFVVCWSDRGVYDCGLIVDVAPLRQHVAVIEAQTGRNTDGTSFHFVPWQQLNEWGAVVAFDPDRYHFLRVTGDTEHPQPTLFERG